MATTSNTTEVRSAVGNKAMYSAMNPAIIINPAATPTDLFSWATAELENLHTWLNILACSDCKFDIETHDLAELVTERIAPVLAGFRAALKRGEV